MYINNKFTTMKENLNSSAQEQLDDEEVEGIPNGFGQSFSQMVTRVNIQ